MTYRECSLGSVLGLAALLIAAFIVTSVEPRALGRESLVRELIDENGKPNVITPEELGLLMEKGTAESVLPDIPMDQKVEAVSSIEHLMGLYEKWKVEGRLNAEGCTTSIGFYHKPSFILGPTEVTLSMRELVQRAEVVVVAEVVEAQPGIVGGTTGTLVHFSVVRDLKTSGIPAGTEWNYRSLEYHFEVGGKLLCCQRDGFYREQPGDLVLLVGRLTQYPELIHPFGVFAIRDGEVLPQPYEFMITTQPVLLSDIEAAIK